MNCTVIYCVSVFPFTLCGCSNLGNSRYKAVAVAQVAGEVAQQGMSIRTCLTAEGRGTKFYFMVVTAFVSEYCVHKTNGDQREKATVFVSVV